MKNKKLQNLSAKFIKATYEVLTGPFVIVFLTHSRKVRPVYGMDWHRRW